MAAPNAEQVHYYLAHQAISGVGADVGIQPHGSGPGELRFLLTNRAGNTYLLTCYAPTARERAEREHAGLELAGSMGLAPALIHADLAGGMLGGPVVIAQAATGAPLGAQPLTDAQAQGWLFLLLTLHHLRPDAVSVASSMSADVVGWWQRTQPVWSACRAAYTAPPFAPLMETLTRLHVIAGVHVEAHRALWDGITRRPCHGDPLPAHVVEAGGRLLLVEWGDFGLGDPALEVGRAATLATLAGELSAERYARFTAEYAVSTRDLRDATLEERVRVVSSVLPLGFAFGALDHLAQSGAPTGAASARRVDQVARALAWVRDALGVEIGDIEAQLAPVRVRPGAASR